MNETIFRILAAARPVHRRWHLHILPPQGRPCFRRKTLPQSADGTPMMLVIRIGGLILWLSPIVYLLNPTVDGVVEDRLSEWVRWVGFGLGIVNVVD
jgi:hypothetical protein